MEGQDSSQKHITSQWIQDDVHFIKESGANLVEIDEELMKKQEVELVRRMSNEE